MGGDLVNCGRSCESMIALFEPMLIALLSYKAGATKVIKGCMLAFR